MDRMFKPVAYLLLALSLMLTACGGAGSPAPAAEPAADVTADFVAYEGESITVRHPEGWAAEAEGEGVILASDEELLTAQEPPEEGGVVVIQTMGLEELGMMSPEGEFDSSDPLAVLNLFITLLTGEGLTPETTVEEPKAVTLGGHSAAQAAVRADAAEGISTVTLITAFVDGNKGVMVMGLAPESDFPNQRPTFDAIISTIDVQE